MIFGKYPLSWLHGELHGGRRFNPGAGGTCGRESKGTGGHKGGMRGRDGSEVKLRGTSAFPNEIWERGEQGTPTRAVMWGLLRWV